MQLHQAVPSQVKTLLSQSRPIERFYRSLQSRNLARTSKRLDICASEVANYFFLAGIDEHYPLRDKVCLEIGSGYVLSHALILYLLGAKKIYATDISPLLDASYITESIQQSVSYMIRDSLAGFEDHSVIRERLNRLLSVKQFTIDALQTFGIEYVAPIDLSERPLGKTIDFMFSKSVLEHVPIDRISTLLHNLEIDLSNNGLMFHFIHLEDHQDIPNHPLDFLSEPSATFTNKQQNTRGNRIRCSSWQTLFAELDTLETQFKFKWSRTDVPLPSVIDPSVHFLDEADLRVSHLGVVSRKKLAQYDVNCL
jgi:hypothetical protein